MQGTLTYFTPFQVSVLEEKIGAKVQGAAFRRGAILLLLKDGKTTFLRVGGPQLEYDDHAVLQEEAGVLVDFWEHCERNPTPS